MKSVHGMMQLSTSNNVPVPRENFCPTFPRN